MGIVHRKIKQLNLLIRPISTKHPNRDNIQTGLMIEQIYKARRKEEQSKNPLNFE